MVMIVMCCLLHDWGPPIRGNYLACYLSGVGHYARVIQGKCAIVWHPCDKNKEHEAGRVNCLLALQALNPKP